MLQKPWFKLFAWFLASFFFFLAAATVISLLKPGPSEMDVMNFMSGMMGAMEKSVMGVMMEIEGNSLIRSVMIWTVAAFPLLAVLSIIAGFLLRKRNSEDKNV
jgi:uncharacterized iron-regulated membrane protein